MGGWGWERRIFQRSHDPYGQRTSNMADMNESVASLLVKQENKRGLSSDPATVKDVDLESQAVSRDSDVQLPPGVAPIKAE